MYKLRHLIRLSCHGSCEDKIAVLSYISSFSTALESFGVLWSVVLSFVEHVRDIVLFMNPAAVFLFLILAFVNLPKPSHYPDV